MSIPHVLLGFLVNGPNHGYELKRAHDAQFSRARPVAFGQIYATLDRLTRQGLVEVVGIEPGEGPERTRYTLTSEGRTALDAWLAKVEPPAPFVSSTLFAKVVVALLAGGSAHEYLRAQRAAHTARMRELAAHKTRKDITVSELVATDYGLAHLDADLQWIELTSQRLDALKEEVLT